MISLEQIAEVLPIKIGEIYRQIELNKVHFLEVNEKLTGNERLQIEEYQK